MLCLSRKCSESIEITAPDGRKIDLFVIEIRRSGVVRIGITAPDDFVIWRTEVKEAIDAKTQTTRNPSRPIDTTKAVIARTKDSATGRA